MRAGDGVFLPLSNPHWVQNGGEVSVSLSVTFRSQYSERKFCVHALNAKLRRAGLKPLPFGKLEMIDSAKFFAYRALRRAHMALGNSDYR